MSVLILSPSSRAVFAVIGKSCVQRPSVSAFAVCAALSAGICPDSARSSLTNACTCACALREMSARISVWSDTRSTGFCSTALMIEAAGAPPICGSTGPRTAFGSITISSAASAIIVPPLIA